MTATPGTEATVMDRKRRARTLGAAMAGGNPDPLRGRSKNDFYATPDDVTTALLKRYGHHVKGVVWEPCAGNGKMAQHLARHPGVTKLLASDLEPRPQAEWHGGVQVAAMDLFSVKMREDGKRRFDVVITNPPFDVAAEVIEHVLGVAEPGVQFFALVLKSSFWHAAKRQSLFNAFPPSLILPLTWRPDFMDLGGPTMEVCWNLWIAGNTHTFYAPLSRPTN